ncbi:MAG TPA: hypothetical protein GX392_09120 [Clostridiales bacterium]|nr:hypothetical protein [Clostridiales bacterium]
MSKKEKKVKNLSAKVISVVFAIILWFVAIGEQNPEIVRSYSDIPVKIQNESQLTRKNLSLVYDVEDPITIRLKGRAKDLSRIEIEEIKGYIDLSDIDKPGEYKIEIDIDGIPLGVRLEKQPERVVVVDTIVSKDIPVEAEITGKEASGYLMQPYTLKPDSIKITGPEVTIDKVVKGRVSLDIKESKSTIEQSLPIKLLDENGQVVESKYVSMNQDFAIVTVPIYPKKTLPIEAAISGKPAPGYEVTDIEIQPKTIIVSGSEALLEDMESISTELIDLEGAKTDIKRTVKLQKYEGIYLDPSQPSEVSVVIRIHPIEVKEEVSNVKIDIENLGINRFAELSTESVDLVLKGDKPVIDTIKDKIKVYVDLDNVSRGEKKFSLKINVPDGVEVLSMDPQEVTVKIK